MASHRTQRLKIFGEAPEVEKLFGSRYRIVVRAEMSDKTEDWYYANKSRIFADFGSLYSAEMAIDGIEAHDGEAYPNARLVSHAAEYLPTGKYVVRFVYETLTGTWTKEREDVIESTENGLRTLTRSEVAKIDTAAPYDEDDVGVKTITSGGKTLYLAGFEDQTKADDQVQIGRVVSRWAEAGTLRELISNGPTNLPNTKTRSITSIGVEPTGDGILLSKTRQNVNGYITYNYTFLEDSSGGNPTEGVLQTYQDVIEVRKPGTVRGRVINDVAEVVQTPPTVGKVRATVTVSLTTDSTVALPVAYNLDGIGCAAYITKTKITPVGVEQGGGLTVAVFNTRRSASSRPFPNHYALNSGDSSFYETPATIIRDNDNIIGESLKETFESSVSISGSSNGPATSGIYDERVEPAFLDDSGTQYYRKTTYTI